MHAPIFIDGDNQGLRTMLWLLRTTAPWRWRWSWRWCCDQKRHTITINETAERQTIVHCLDAGAWEFTTATKGS